MIKGEGGEIEINPDSASHLYGTLNGQSWDEEWPALSPSRHVKPAQLDPQLLLAVWNGDAVDDYGLQAIHGTLTLALRGLGRSREQALGEAAEIWQKRLA